MSPTPHKQTPPMPQSLAAKEGMLIPGAVAGLNLLKGIWKQENIDLNTQGVGVITVPLAPIVLSVAHNTFTKSQKDMRCQAGEFLAQQVKPKSESK